MAQIVITKMNFYFSGISNKKNINKKELSNKGQRRPIVIDGCNVAYHHGRHDMFSGRMISIYLYYILIKSNKLLLRNYQYYHTNISIFL